MASLFTTRRLLVVAQLCVLVAIATGLQFLFNTTGGTVFVFTSLAPALIGLSILILAGVLLHNFRQRHRLFHLREYEPGEVIFHEGDLGDCVYFIRSGEVEVVRETDDGEKLLAKLSSGQYFGEMALLSSDPRNATVRAVAETELAVLGKDNFITLLNVMPSTKDGILETIQRRAVK